MQGKPLHGLLQELRETGRIPPLVSTASSSYSELSDRALARKLNQAQQALAQEMIKYLSPATIDRHPLFQYREWAGTVTAGGELHLPSDLGQLVMVSATSNGAMLRRAPAGRNRSGDYEIRGLSLLYMPGYAGRTVYVTYISNLYGALIGGTVAAGSTTTSLVASAALSYDGAWVYEDDIYANLHVAFYDSATPAALAQPTSVVRVSGFTASTRTFALADALPSTPTTGNFWCTCTALPPIGTELLIYEALIRIPQARAVYESYVVEHARLRKSLHFQVAVSGAFQ